MTEPTKDEIGLCVVEIRDQIREKDPNAYAGFVTDAACNKVARTLGIRATDALRAYRLFVPLSPGARMDVYRALELGQPDEEAVAAAQSPCLARP